MAWTEQCKVAFRVNALGKLGKYKNKNRKLNGVLKELSKESGIPYNTLRRWWYEKTEGENNSISIKNDTDKTDCSKLPCLECRENPIYLTKRGKPVGEDSKYYGLCKKCKDFKSKLISLDNIKNENDGMKTVCPNCFTIHYINKKRIKEI